MSIQPPIFTHLREFLLATAVLATALNGCSAKAPRRVQRSEMSVSVETGGKRVENFEQQLVHRVDLDAGSVRTLRTEPEKSYRFVPELDREGKVRGIRVVAVRNLENPLRLVPGDVLTAVNRTNLKTVDQLSTELEKSFSASAGPETGSELVTVTIDRNAVPHKNIYYPVK